MDWPKLSIQSGSACAHMASLLWLVHIVENDEGLISRKGNALVVQKDSTNETLYLDIF